MQRTDARLAPHPGTAARRPGTTAFDVPSAGGGFRVLVRWPRHGRTGRSGAPALALVLDAAWTFGTLSDLMTRLEDGGAQRPEATVLVGLGYPTPTLACPARRAADLVCERAQSTRRILTEEVLPRVEAALPCPPARRMILGHSYGGALALRAGFARPDLFTHVAAGSPSLWTDAGVFAEAPPRAGVLITLGALECPVAAREAGLPEDRIARLAERDVTGRAKALAARMGTAPLIFPGADHGAALLPFLGGAMDWFHRDTEGLPDIS